MTSLPSTLFPDTATVNQSGHLVVGGCDLAELASQLGTPLYILDEMTIRNQCRKFRAAFAQHLPNSVVAYAAKAFLNQGLAQLMEQENIPLDVVSGGELAVARSVRFPATEIHFHGNNKTPQELEEALEYGVGRFVIDNLTELERLNHLATSRSQRQKVWLRVSPDVDPHTHTHTTTGILDNKFGFPLTTGQAGQALEQALQSPGLDVVGLHFHLGSPIFETDPYRKAIERVVELAYKYSSYGFKLEELSPGGGFAIAYTQEDEPPPPEAYAKVISQALRDACRKTGLPLPQVIVEPGRALVGRAGIAIYTVGSVKDIPSVRKYVAVDGGMGDNIRPALYGARYEVVAVEKMLEIPNEKVTIAGKYCESGDILARDISLPPIEQGDLVAIPSSGAYCLSMASTYNLNPRPPIALLKTGQARLLRRRETYRDLIALDTPLET